MSDKKANYVQHLSDLRTRISTMVERYRVALPTWLYETAFGAPPATLAADAPATPRQPPNRMLAVLAGLAAVGFYALLVYFAVRNWDPLALREVQFDIRGLLVAFLCQIIGYLWNLRVWQMLFGWFGQRIPFLMHLKIYAYSSLAVKIPGFFWGIATRVVLYRRQGAPLVSVGVISFLEIIFFAIAGGILALLVALLQPDAIQLIPPPLIALICVICLIATHPAILKRITNKLHKEYIEEINQLTWRAILLIVAAYTGILALGGVSLFAIISSVVGYDPSLLLVSIQIWALSALWASLLSWLPIDFGLRQGPFLVIISALFAPSIVVVLFIVWRVWVNACELMWGVIGFGMSLALDRRRRARQLAAEREYPAVE